MSEIALSNLTSNLGSPARSFMWGVQINIEGIDASIKYRARTTSTPAANITPIDVPYMQTAGARFKGKRQVSHQQQIAFLEGEDGLVYSSLIAATEKVIDPETGEGMSDTDRGTVMIRLLETEAGQPWMGFEFKDAFIGGIQEAQLSQDGSGLVIVPAVIFYNDWAKLIQ